MLFRYYAVRAIHFHTGLREMIYVQGGSSIMHCIAGECLIRARDRRPSLLSINTKNASAVSITGNVII